MKFVTMRQINKIVIGSDNGLVTSWHKKRLLEPKMA